MEFTKRENMATSDRNWAELPSDILFLIIQYLLVSDNVRIRAVCTSWASALGNFYPSRLQFPWLILIHTVNQKGKISLMSPLEKRYYRIPHIPKFLSRHSFIGYKKGCLVILHENMIIWIVNPLTGAKIHLPAFSKLRDDEHLSFKCINKIVLSSGLASSNTLIAIAIYNSCMSLAYARPGDNSWTPLYILPKGTYIEDIVYHEEKFFVISDNGELHVLIFSGPHVEALLITNSSTIFHAFNTYDYNNYLVSTCKDELLYVKKGVMNNEIKIMKFDQEANYCWVETKDLGEQCLFLDDKYCMSVSTSDIPEMKRNCIYMINENSDNVVAFDMDKDVNYPSFSIDSQRSFRPMWIMPVAQV